MFTHTGEVYVPYMRKSRKVKLRETEKFWVSEDGTRYRKSDGRINLQQVSYLLLNSVKINEEVQ